MIPHIQHGTEATTEGEGAGKILWRAIVVSLPAQPRAKPPIVVSLNGGDIVLKLHIILCVERMADWRAATIEGSQHLDRWR